MNAWYLLGTGPPQTVGTGLFVDSEFALVNPNRNDLKKRVEAWHHSHHPADRIHLEPAVTSLLEGPAPKTRPGRPGLEAACGQRRPRSWRRVTAIVGLLSVAIVVAMTVGTAGAAALEKPVAALLFAVGAVAAPALVMVDQP